MAVTTMKFVQARNYTRGRSNAIDVLVIHTMESPEKPDTAESVANWFGGATAPEASAHYCIDSDSIVQCVHDEDVAWHAPGANHNGLGFEHAGRAAQRRKTGATRTRRRCSSCPPSSSQRNAKSTTSPSCGWSGRPTRRQARDHGTRAGLRRVQALRPPRSGQVVPDRGVSRARPGAHGRRVGAAAPAPRGDQGAGAEPTLKAGRVRLPGEAPAAAPRAVGLLRRRDRRRLRSGHGAGGQGRAEACTVSTPTGSPVP